MVLAPGDLIKVISYKLEHKSLDSRDFRKLENLDGRPRFNYRILP